MNTLERLRLNMIIKKERKKVTQSNDENEPITTSKHELEGQESPTITKFRETNPNLQPLGPQEVTVIKNKGRHSIQELPAIEPSRSSEALRRHQSLSSAKDFRSKFSRRSILRNGEKQNIDSMSTSSTQKFWKYHVLEFGNGLYLTTNPDARHMYCRNAPGYHVELLYPNNRNGNVDRSGSSGFRLVFKSQIDGQVFLTVTKSSKGFDIDLLRRYYENEKGDLSLKEDFVESHHHTTKEIDIEELKGRYYETTAKLFRHQVSDFNNKQWFLGSIPQFKTATKLKNKRFIYFHKPENEKILACFRPHEFRAKKRIIKKFNRSMKMGSNNYYYDEENDDGVSLSSNQESVYYAPGDGLFEEDPPDDSPNNEKMGWITIYDDYETLKIPGMWEMILGLTLAAGLSKSLEENGDHRYIP